VSMLLRFDSVVAGYGRGDILRGLDLDVPEQAVTCLVGPNGAGKSTALKTLSGLLKPRAGRILFEGHDIAGLSPARVLARGIVHVPQERSLFPLMTVWDNVLMGGFILKDRTDLRRRVHAVAERFPIVAERRHARAGSLSGGERNRVHLAKMLKSGANVLLLDEPTNDLDVDTLRALEEALEDFAGCAVIISHDRWFLDRIATHMLSFEGDSHVEWFEGNFQDYEKDKMRRLGQDSVIPHRVKYKKLTR